MVNIAECISSICILSMLNMLTYATKILYACRGTPLTKCIHVNILEWQIKQSVLCRNPTKLGYSGYDIGEM